MTTKSPVIVQYKNYYLCQLDFGWRIKTEPKLSYAVHHGSFGTLKEAKKYVDGLPKKIRTAV
jgi:hypothetical protein